MEVINFLPVLLVAVLVVGEAKPTRRHEPHVSLSFWLIIDQLQFTGDHA